MISFTSITTVPPYPKKQSTRCRNTINCRKITKRCNDECIFRNAVTGEMEVKHAAQKRSVVLLALALFLLVRVAPNGAHADSQQEKSISTQEVLQRFHAKLCAEDEKQLFLANIGWTELPALVDNCNIREIAVSAAGDCARLLSNLSVKMLFIFDSEGQYHTGFSFQANEACSVFFCRATSAHLFCKKSAPSGYGALFRQDRCLLVRNLCDRQPVAAIERADDAFQRGFGVPTRKNSRLDSINHLFCSDPCECRWSTNGCVPKCPLCGTSRRDCPWCSAAFCCHCEGNHFERTETHGLKRNGLGIMVSPEIILSGHKNSAVFTLVTQVVVF